MFLCCPACAAVSPDTNRFCSSCGSSLSTNAQKSASVVSTLVSEAQWGTLKHATILFADIVSSTEYVSAMDPEQAMEQLSPAVHQMCTAVEQYGGTVVRTLGDGVMALFGVPRALEGHATLACEAALCMQAAFAGPGLRIRIGLHSGPVALDPETVASTRGGGVHGHAIHLASRVVAMAEPGGICLTADCLVLVRNAFDVRSMGRHPLRGIEGSIALHSLFGKKNDVQRHNFHEAVLSQFCGRSLEFGLLQEALSAAKNGAGSVMGLSGAPGTGKSRLCHEFVQSCHFQEVPVFEVRTQLYGHATPLQPVLMMLRACFFFITPLHDAAQARVRIAAELAKLGPVSGGDLALINEFLGVADARICTLNAKARRVRLLGLLHELVKNAGTQTLVIIFEDLHWLDEASGEFLSVLVNAVANTRILLVLNYRPVYLAPWSDLPHFHAVPLSDLSTADTEILVCERLAAHPDLQGFCPLIVERSAGNPFFAEELVQSLVEKSTASGERGAKKIDLVSLAQALPATVQAVIGERIDRLVSAQRTLLQICAVIGKEIPLAVLQEVAVSLVSQLESGLDGLCEVELLQLLREITGGRRFAFRHPLIQEVAYGTQLKARRASLHAAVAVAMKTHYSAQPGEFAALIAYHYEAAGLFLNAAQHEALAARWTGSTHSAQAIKHWRRVWTLLDGQECSSPVNSLRALAGGRIVYLGWREGLSPQDIEQISQEAIEHASLVDNRLVQLLLFAQGRTRQSSGGSADEYVACILKALSLTPPGKDAGRVAMLNVALSQAYAWAGLLEQGLAANDKAHQGLAYIDQFDREFIDFSIEQWGRGIRVRLLLRLGRLDDARMCLEQMLASDQVLDDPVIRQITHHLHVEFAAATQNAALAQFHVPFVLNLAQQYNSPYSKIFAFWCSGLAEATTGDLVAAERRFSEALECILAHQVAVEFEVEIRASLAECHYQLGDFDLALGLAKANIVMARQRSNRLAECRALIVCGGVLGQKKDVDSWREALGFFDQAEQLVTVTKSKIYGITVISDKRRLLQLIGPSVA